MTLSQTARAQVFNQEDGGFLILLTITHDLLPSPIRVVNNTENVISGGNEYIRYPFDVQLPDERDGSAPIAKLTIDNVSREIVQTLRQISTPPTIGIQVVRLDNPDSVEMSLPTFKLRNVSFDALTISGDLIIDDVTKEGFPARSFTPAEYPGLF